MGQTWRPEMLVASELGKIRGVRVTVEHGQLVATLTPTREIQTLTAAAAVLRNGLSAQFQRHETVDEMLALVKWRVAG